MKPHGFTNIIANNGYDCSISADGNTVILAFGNIFRFHWTGSEWTTNIIFPYDQTMTGFGNGVVCSSDGKTVWVKGDKIYKFASEW